MWGNIKQLIDSYSPEDQKLIEKAYLIAEKCHKGQKRKSGEPYLAHPVSVACEIIKLKLDSATVAAALLHDVLEDCALTKQELEHEVGKDVVFLVESLTKLDPVRYQGFERRVESTRKMFLAVAKDVRVVLIKLADRLHNMRTIKALPEEKQKRIAEETLELYAPLAYRLGMGELKGELEDLAFPIVQKDEYNWLISEIQIILPEKKKYLQDIKPIIQNELLKGHVNPIKIDYRVKHYYSLWRKLLKYNLDINKVMDITAMRIIVPTVEECYQTLGIIHSLWRPLPGKIKDYISLPKSNGYQSIHTTVFCVGNQITEFQSRTPEMHEEAEHGIAAHWAYEEAGKPKSGIKSKDNAVNWVKKLQEWQKEFRERPGEEFVEALKIDFFKDRIFVLTPKGEVVDLPQGSTPIDFAYHIHSDIGNHMSGAKINGKMVSFSHPLVSGDKVEILTGKKNKPSKDWLSIAVTSLARGHIRSALRKTGAVLPSIHRDKSQLRNVLLVFRNFEDRVGLLKDITSVISREKINISKADIDEGPFITIYIQIRKSYSLDKLITRLKKIRGVNQIEVKL